MRAGTRYLKRVVAMCLWVCALFAAAAMVGVFCGVDGTGVLALVFGLFGGELLMTCVLRLLERREMRDGETRGVKGAGGAGGSDAGTD